MRLLTLLTVLQAALVAATSCECFDKDHCLAAVALCPRKGCLQHKQDCSSYLRTTVTPTTTKTVTVPGHTQTVTVPYRRGKAQQAPSPVTATTTVPYTLTTFRTIFQDQTVTTSTETVAVTTTTAYETDHVTVVTGTETDFDIDTVTQSITIGSGTTTIFQQKRTAATAHPIPSYAKKHCTKAEAYSHACHCLGIHPCTITAPKKTMTTTVADRRVTCTVTATESSPAATEPTSTTVTKTVTTTVLTVELTTTVVQMHMIGATTTQVEQVGYTALVTDEVEATTTVSDTVTVTATEVQPTYTGFDNVNTGHRDCRCRYHVRSGYMLNTNNAIHADAYDLRICEGICDNEIACSSFDWNRKTQICRLIYQPVWQGPPLLDPPLPDPSLEYIHGERLWKSCRNTEC